MQLYLSLIHGFLSPYLQKKKKKLAPELFLVLSTPGRYINGLRAERPGFDSRQGQEILLSSTATSGAHPASYPLGAGDALPGE
jgi:hypothetical protein